MFQVKHYYSMKNELIDTCWDVNLNIKTAEITIVGELIDTCWDVNDFLRYASLTMSKELIDTCWDVNHKIQQSEIVSHTELIDTCWDVNSLDEVRSAWLKGINRYMLGCKFPLSRPCIALVPRINRYMLGCKLEKGQYKYRKKLELIDTCWDVNHFKIQEVMFCARINRYMLGCKSRTRNIRSSCSWN